MCPHALPMRQPIAIATTTWKFIQIGIAIVKPETAQWSEKTVVQTRVELSF